MNKKPKQNSPATPSKGSPKKKRPSSKKADGSARDKLKNPPPLDLPLSDTWYHMQDLMNMFKIKRPALDGYIKTGILISHKLGCSLRFNKAYVDWMVKNGQRIFSTLLAILSMGTDSLVEI